MTTRAGSALLALVLLMSLGGCGGDSVPTRQEVRDKRINDPVRRESVNARVNNIRLLTVRIERPEEGSHALGGNSALFLTLANSGPPDRLVAVSSVDAQSVIQRIGDGQPAPRIRVTVPRNGTVAMQDPAGLHLELVGLKRDIGKRSFVPVTFRFVDAGAVSFSVFVTGFNASATPSPTN